MYNQGQDHSPIPKSGVSFNNRQLNVIKLLVLRSTTLADRYKSILMALAHEENPEFLIQAAHSARFLIKDLYQINPDVPIYKSQGEAFSMIRDFVKVWEGPETNGREIAKASQHLADFYREASLTKNRQLTDLFVKEDISGMASEEHLSLLIESLSAKIRFFDKIAHYETTGIDKGHFETALYEVEGVIIGLLSEHFQLLPEVEQLLKIENPASDDLAEIRGLISRPRLFNSFFNNLKRPGWFEPLKKAGFFKTPIKAKKHPDGSISSPLWPQCSFLKKCAPAFPQEVIKTILEANDTDNWNVASEFAEIALLVPTKEASKLVRGKTELWIKRFGLGNLPMSLAELAVHLAAGDEPEAFGLARQLLSLRRNPQSEAEDSASTIARSEKAVGYFDYHMYERTLEKIVPALAKSDPIKTIELLCKTLDSAITMQGPDRKKDPRNDDLLFYRPTIPDGEGNTYGNQYIKSLIDSLRDVLIGVGQNRTTQAGACLEKLREHKPYIFLRIEMYILSLFPADNVARIEELASDPAIVRSHAVEYELDGLLKVSYDLLSKDAQVNYLKIVEEGPGTDD